MDKQQWLEKWFNGVLARGDHTVLAECAADPFVFHLPGGRVLTISHEEYVEYLEYWHQRFKGMTFMLKQTLEVDNKLVAVYQSSATYCGGWLKIPARSNKAVTMTGMMLFILEDGVMTECWLEDSSFDLYQQLTRSGVDKSHS
ncbi:hypothetical protein A3K86_04020 [Photobacterium jeanii]|uniref:SnoaL-like domain-containing protein n=1 Tax=Photobacterium jeanii TaxID=858640 RepID=A0A178KL31_9GAMM|nr:nuclear transport factor 2 family protein [Photobacterium jeanii]OAN18088.1 hypothetical protein A3K86_04020 [Photobacterium jeanii]PST92238.1 nuclear transport factor 2 family protein [Photobacterium jeanii]